MRRPNIDPPSELRASARTCSPLKRYRTIRGWTQREVAERLGVDRSYVAHVEIDPSRNIEDEARTALAKSYGLTLAIFDALRAGKVDPLHVAVDVEAGKHHVTHSDNARHAPQGDRPFSVEAT